MLFPTVNERSTGRGRYSPSPIKTRLLAHILRVLLAGYPNRRYGVYVNRRDPDASVHSLCSTKVVAGGQQWIADRSLPGSTYSDMPRASAIVAKLYSTYLVGLQGLTARVI
jgi:hypothetical protein